MTDPAALRAEIIRLRESGMSYANILRTIKGQRVLGQPRNFNFSIDGVKKVCTGRGRHDHGGKV